MNLAFSQKLMILLRSVVAAIFLLTANVLPLNSLWASSLVNFPEIGRILPLSPSFIPANLKGIIINFKDPLAFDFLIQRGDISLTDSEKEIEYQKLIKYFLAALTLSEKDMWVNLSPYEKNRVISDNFGKTEMGRDLLGQDYILKQITASLIYPENGLGQQFWDQVYKRAYEQYGTTTIPVNTFNKVWIVPDEAVVFEKDNHAVILRSHLKVMLEQDYLSLKKNKISTDDISSKVVREIILPAIEKEVNEGKNFANLRQIYSGMILATWYKKALKESFLGKAYANQGKVKGIEQDDPKANQEIYAQYIKAYKKGVFNFIKEDYDKYTNQSIPRKYFSGGFDSAQLGVVVRTQASLSRYDSTQLSAVLKDACDVIGVGLRKMLDRASTFGIVSIIALSTHLGELQATAQTNNVVDIPSFIRWNNINHGISNILRTNNQVNIDQLAGKNLSSFVAKNNNKFFKNNKDFESLSAVLGESPIDPAKAGSIFKEKVGKKLSEFYEKRKRGALSKQEDSELFLLEMNTVAYLQIVLKSMNQYDETNEARSVAGLNLGKINCDSLTTFIMLYLRSFGHQNVFKILVRELEGGKKMPQTAIDPVTKKPRLIGHVANAVFTSDGTLMEVDDGRMAVHPLIEFYRPDGEIVLADPYEISPADRKGLIVLGVHEENQRYITEHYLIKLNDFINEYNKMPQSSITRAHLVLLGLIKERIGVIEQRYMPFVRQLNQETFLKKAKEEYQKLLGAMSIWLKTMPQETEQALTEANLYVRGAAVKFVQSELLGKELAKARNFLTNGSKTDAFLAYGLILSRLDMFLNSIDSIAYNDLLPQERTVLEDLDKVLPGLRNEYIELFISQAEEWLRDIKPNSGKTQLLIISDALDAIYSGARLKPTREQDAKLKDLRDKVKQRLSALESVPIPPRPLRQSPPPIKLNSIGEPSVIKPRELLAFSDSDVGGIDLDATMLNLQVQRDGNGMSSLPLMSENLDSVNFEGLSPEIKSIQPASQVPAIVNFFGATMN